MTQQIINVGTADKGNGDPLRTAFIKVNNNFNELYAALGADFENLETHLIPKDDDTYDLGSPSKKWRSLYVSGSTIYLGNHTLSINDQNELTFNNNRVAHENGEFMTLDNLSDLNVNSPNAGDTIAWSGSQYVNVPILQDRLADDGDELILVGGANPYVTFPAITGGDQLQISGAEVSALSGNLALSGQATITLITNGAGAGGIGSQYFTLGADGSLTIPGTIGSEDEFKIEVNLTDSTKYTWRFGEDGELTFPDGTSQSTAGASLGNLRVNSSAGGTTIGTVDNPNTGGWGGYDLYIDSGNNSDAKIYIPSVSSQAANMPLQILNNALATSIIQLFGRGGVQVTTNNGVNEKVFEFADNGTLIFPDGSLALTDSVLDNGLDADIKGSVFGDDSTILVDGVSGVLRANVNVPNTWTVTTGDKTWSFIYGDVSEGTNPIFEFPGSLQAVGSQTAIYAPADDLSGNWGMSIDAANSPYYVDIGGISGSNFWRFSGDGRLMLPTPGILSVVQSDPNPPAGLENINWTFDSYGQLTLPANRGIIGFSTGNNDELRISNNRQFGSVQLAWQENAVLPAGGPGAAANFTLDASGAKVTLTADSFTTTKEWTFGYGGGLTLPNNGVIQETIVTNEMWGTTTTSLTLVPGGAANGTQRLEIYSTGGGEGNHIHIRSGDQNQTDLFLGNDTQYFAVAASGANYIQARNGAASTGPGVSAGPGANVNIYAGSAGDNGGNVSDGNSGGDVFIASGISTAGLGGQIYLQTSSGPTGFGSIKLSTDGGSSYLEFNEANQLVFPDSTTQNTAWTKSAAAVQSSAPSSPVTGQLWYDTDDGNTYIWTGSAWVDSNPAAAAPTVDILDTNGIDTNYSITFVETRDTAQILRADVDLTFNSWSNTLTAGNVTTGILKIEDGAHEKFQTKSYATGVVTHDCSLGHVFYHLPPSANWTVNLTNLNLAVGYATAVTLVIEQGATGYYPSAVQVAGNAVPLAWQGNTTPTPSSNRFDVVTFSILYDGLYTVLGQLTGF